MSSRTRGRSQSGTGGRIFISLVLSIFLVVGSLLTLVIGGSVARDLATRSWTRTACTIVTSEYRLAGSLEAAPGWHVRYRYEFDGREYFSEVIRRGDDGISAGATDENALQLSQRYLAGGQTTCFVNPAAPTEAVLRQRSLWAALAILFPLLFVVIGAGGLYLVWRRRPAKASTSVSAAASLSPRTARQALTIGIGFFSVFLFAGLGFLYVFTLRPVVRMLDARDWRPVPCEIVTSEVRTHDGSEGDTYSVALLFRYEFDGGTYLANRHSFHTGSSSGYAGKAEIVGRLRPGTRTECFVNPDDPTEAVIERGFTRDLWWGLIPAVFVAVGLGGVITVWRARRKIIATAGGGAFTAPATAARSALFTRASRLPAAVPASAPTADGAVVLAPRNTRRGKLIGFLFFTVFWNGIMAVFLADLLGGWQRGSPDWVLTIFLLPFLGVGLFMVGLTIHAALGLSNPRPVLTVNSAALPPGATLELRWTTTGRVTKLRRLRVWLEGREEARYRRGTKTHTDTAVFAMLDLLDTGDPATMTTGTARLTLPEETMHSLEAPNNQIVWSLRVRGEIPRWPDVNDEFAFTVAPGAAVVS